MTEAKFKVGDKVRCVNSFEAPSLRKGEEYTIRRIDSDGDLWVMPDDQVDGWFSTRFELVEPVATSALSTQVGGSHYKDFAIQPAEFIHRNGIGFLEGNVIKYVTRYKAKNGIQDLEKARHYIDLLIEMETKK